MIKKNMQWIIWGAWWVGALLIILSWFKIVPVQVGWTGFGISCFAVVVQVIIKKYWIPPQSELHDGQISEANSQKDNAVKKTLILIGSGILIFIFGFLSGSFWTSNKFISSFEVRLHDKEEYSDTYSSDEAFWGYKFYGGMPEREDKLKHTPEGDGYFLVKFLYDGKPAAGIKCKIVLNRKYKTSPLETDQNGIITLRLPEGNWQVNSIQCSSWKNKPAGEYMLVSPGERRIESGLGEFLSVDAKGKEITVRNTTPDSPQLALLINPRVEIIWPDKNKPKQNVTVAHSNIDWQPYLKASQYVVRIHRVTREGRSTTFMPIVYKKVSGRHTLSFSEIPHSRDPAAKEEYAVSVEAYAESGEFLSESQNFNGTFSFTDGSVLVENQRDISSTADQGKIDSLYQGSKTLQAAEALIKEKMFDQAQVLLNKVKIDDLQGKKELMTGYLYATKGDCMKAQIAFDNTRGKGEDCIPEEYKGNCK